MRPINKIVLLWGALAAILAMIAFLISFMAPSNKKWVLFWAVVLLFVFAVVWYVPHAFRERKLVLSKLPAVYFGSGTMLAVLGCVSSALFSSATGQEGHWTHIAEVLPLILGAVVGGTYCGNAILGQEFDGETFHLGFWGAMLGALPILVALSMLCLPSMDVGVNIAVLCAAISPPLAILLMGDLDNSRSSVDTAFRIFVTGFFLICVTGLTAIWLLPAADHLKPHDAFLNQAQTLNIVKNLVPSYCGAIGVGLITRGMERNTTRFSLDDWAKSYFDAFKFISATENHVQFKWKDGSKPDQIIVMVIDETVVGEMRAQSHKRAQYGDKMHTWLNRAAKHRTLKRSRLVMLDAPRVETLEKV